MTMITPSSKLTLTKGNKSWSSTAVAAALELVDPPGCRNSIAGIRGLHIPPAGSIGSG